nr:myrosinase 4 [Contarinia nasturtii]
MRSSKLICIIFIFISSGSASPPKSESNRYFPPDFLFGAATSAYQVEGGWDSDGKGPSIWDDFVHSYSENILDHQNADVGANSYEYYLDDIEALKSLNMNFYRFSISWSRILPTGDITQINEKGIEYYNKLINALIENEIQPMVTMFHFDLPQKLQLFGGFTNSVIVRYFEEYANLLYNRFGDRVKYWITINEPNIFCKYGYGTNKNAPGMNASGVADYLCIHNALKAHAVAYHLYKDKFYNQFKGRIGICLLSYFFYSDSNDAIAVDEAIQFTLGFSAHPIFSTKGDYPPFVIERIYNASKEEGRLRSRLPTFSEYWIKKIKGSSDFFGLNYYTSRYVSKSSQPIVDNYTTIDSILHSDLNLRLSAKSEGIKSASNRLYSVPEGLGDILKWIKAEYNNPEVIMTENGWPDDGQLEDDGRIAYFHDHLEKVLDAIQNDDCNVKGYTAWSLIDNFEWHSGYTRKFGLFSVNMSSPRKERIPKKSTRFMKTLIETRKIPELH